MPDHDYPPPTTPPVVSARPPVVVQVYPPPTYTPPIVRKKKKMPFIAVIGIAIAVSLVCLLVALGPLILKFNEQVRINERQEMLAEQERERRYEPTITPKHEVVWNYRDDTGYYWADANGALEIMGYSRISNTNEWNVNCKNVSGRELFNVAITINFKSGSDYIGFMHGVTELTISPNQEFSMRMSCADPNIDSYFLLHPDIDNPLGSVYSYESE
ncbi:MAG: hypothetical protein LBK67_00025 [Coriobacteriales bacterium]|nr:hypothetical protein [Coriobacteriales bacterium]